MANGLDIQQADALLDRIEHIERVIGDNFPSADAYMALGMAVWEKREAVKATLGEIIERPQNPLDVMTVTTPDPKDEIWDDVWGENDFVSRPAKDCVEVVRETGESAWVEVMHGISVRYFTNAKTALPWVQATVNAIRKPLYIVENATGRKASVTPE